MRLDHERLRARRRELGISERELAAAGGVAKMTLRYLEAGGGDGTLTLDLLRRMAARLAMEPAELLCSDEPPAPAPDAAQAGAILAELGEPVSAETVAGALGWSLQRTRTALAALADQLPAVGQALERADGQFAIRRSATMDPDALAAARRANLADRSLDGHQAKALARLLAGGLDDKRRLTRLQHVGLAALRNAGLVMEQPNPDWTGRQSLTVSPDVAYSLLLDNE